MNKILFILHLPPPVHGAAMVGQYIRNSYLLNSSFDCHYFNLTLAKGLDDIGKGGVKKAFSFCSQLISLWKTVRAVNPQICYITPNTKGRAFYKDFCVVMLLKIMRQDIVAHYHNKGVSERQDKLVDHVMYKCFFNRQRVILLAGKLYEDMKKYVLPEDVYICPNGIPSQRAMPAVQKRAVFRILFLSNMMKEKGVWDLVEACSLLKKEGADFRCDFVGKWSDITEEAFLEAIERKGLTDCVKAYGAKYGPDKKRFMQRANLFVLPSHNEAFPLVLLEAMQYGLPCIATAEGGIPAIIDDNRTGFLITPRDANLLAKRIMYLKNRPDVGVKMGMAGRAKFLREFTLKRFEKRMKNILNQILAC